jgi:hypothetical protein
MAVRARKASISSNSRCGSSRTEKSRRSWNIMQSIAATEGIGVPFSWRKLREHPLCLYHIQPVQALTPDHRARVAICQWLLDKCGCNTQFVDNILFTDEAEFTRDGIVKLRNTHVWVGDKSNSTMASRHQRLRRSNLKIRCLS